MGEGEVAPVLEENCSSRSFSEALLFHFPGNTLLQTFHVLLLLLFEVTPHLLQFRMAVGVGYVLVVAPEGVQSFVQILNQIVIVIFHTLRLTDMLQ